MKVGVPLITAGGGMAVGGLLIVTGRPAALIFLALAAIVGGHTLALGRR